MLERLLNGALHDKVSKIHFGKVYKESCENKDSKIKQTPKKSSLPIWLRDDGVNSFE